MKALLYILAAVAAFGQAQTPFKIHQGGATAGQIWFQEPRASGTDWFKLRAGVMSADVTAILPTSDGSANQCLSTDGAGQWGWRTCSGASVDILTTDYDWYQTPGVSLTAATPATVALTPCPAGAAPYIAHYSLRIAGGTGAAETVLVTAVTGSGATCDIEFTPANNHTGSWTIGSASDGIQEAINYAIANTGHRVFIPNGVSTVDPVAPGEESTIYVQGAVTIAGGNQSINGGSEIALNHDGQWAIIVTTGTTNWPVHFEKFSIQGTGLTTGGGVKITASSTHNQLSKIKDMQFYSLPVGLWCEKCAGQEISGNFFFGFTDAGVRMQNTFDTDAGDQTVTNNYFQVIGASTAVAIDWLSAGGAKIANNKFNLQGGAINMALSAESIITTITGNSFDNQKLYSVRMRGTTGFLGAAITGNVVTGAGDASYIAFDLGDNTTDVLSNITVSSNSMQAAGTGIKVGDAANVSISGNVLGSFTTAIDIKSTASGVALGKNTCYSVATCYAVDPAAGVRPTSPLFASGYGGWAASGTNIAAIAEFAPPASGEVNNAILFQTNTTGTNSQRGIWWDTAANMHFARFSSNRSTTHTNDLKLEADGDAHFSYNVGIGRTPAVELDVDGVSRVYDGTIDLRFQVGSGAAYIGTNTNHPVLFTQDATVRLYLSNSALLPNPSAGDTFNIGDPTIRFLATYSKIVDTVASGGTGDYIQTRKLQLFDNTGSSTGASYWDLNVVMSGVGAGQNSYFYLRDNGGNTVWRADKIASGAAVATTTIYTDLLPDSTANTRDLGKTTQRWDEINGASLDLTGAANITGNLSAAVINATGSPAYRVSGTTVINASRAATFTDLTINTSAAPAVGDVWTATSTGGAGSWQTPTSSAPFVDSTAIIKGSADATKLLKIEVDGFSTATTRTLTPQNASYTIAGTDIAQTFTQTQTFNGSTAMVLNGTITGDLLFTSANTYIVGNGTNYANNMHSATFTTYGQVKPGSGVTTADLGGSTVPFRKLWVGDISFTGTMTPPSGSAFSGTKTVRASGGASDCTLTFSAGIMTGGTC